MNAVRFAVLGALLASGTGCTIHYLVDVTDNAAGTMTMVETNDVLFPLGFGKHRYWECTEKEGKLVCKRTCDTKDESGEKITCPISVGM